MSDIEVKGTIVSNDDKWIYDWFDIEATCPKSVAEQLENAKGQDVTIQINSGGGDVFAGNEIYYLISAYKGTKTVDIVGLAASAATIIACAGDTVRAVPGAQYMIHNVSSQQQGDYRSMDKMSEILQNANKTISNVYRLKTGMTEAELLKLMNEETWMDATKAKEYGFIDEIIGDNGKLASPLSLHNSVAQVLSEEVKQKIRNTVKMSDKQDPAFFIAQKNLELLKLKGESDMKFKDFADYKAQRDTAIEEAQALLNGGKMEEYDAKVKEVEALDKDYEDFAEKQANLAALQGAVRPPFSATERDRVIDSVNLDDGDMEYRKAFMNYAVKGVPMPMSNSDATTTSSDVGVLIPNTILNRIVEKMEKSGNILALVTRTYYKGGVEVPISSAKPTATWTTERGTTDKQKKPVGSVTFSYYKLKVQVTMSIIVDNVTLDVFERTIADNIAEAITKALETAIISGTGSGQPKGILKETVVDGQNVDIASGKKITYADLCKAEGLLPSSYDDAKWCMKKSTYMTEIAGMTDSNGQPIARVNVGLDGKPEYTILGRKVEFSEDVPGIAAAASADTVIAFIFRFADYMLNTNMGVNVSRYTDQDTDDEVTKAIMLADGKVIDKNSLVTITAKKTAA